jgi:hypothetical protein
MSGLERPKISVRTRKKEPTDEVNHLEITISREVLDELAEGENVFLSETDVDMGEVDGGNLYTHVELSVVNEIPVFDEDGTERI